MGLERIGVEAVVQNIGNYLSDMDKLNKATGNAADQTEKSAKKSEALSKALQGVGKVVAGLGLTGLFADMIKEAGDSELAVNQLNNQIKNVGKNSPVTSKAAQDLATKLQGVTRYSDETVLSVETMLLRFKEVSKDIFPRTTKAALDMSAALGMDATDAAKMLGKALEVPVDGATALTRAGVKLSDASIAVIKNLVSQGKTLEAQKYLLRQVELATGGAAEAAGKTYVGQLDILKNKFSDVKEAAGAKLLPVLTDIVKGAGDFIDKMGPAAPTILLVASAIGVLTLALGPLGTILGIILGPIGLIIGGVVALYAAFQTNFLGIRDLVTSVWNFLQPIVADIAGFFQNLFAGFDPGAYLTDLKQRLKMALEQMFSSLGIDYRVVDKVFQNLQNIADWFTQTAIPNVLDFISGTVIPGIQDFIDILNRIWTDVQPFLQNLYDWFVNDALPVVGRVIDNFQANIVEPLIRVLSGIWAAIQPALANVYDWFVTTGLPAVKAIAEDFWQKIMIPLVQLLTTIWSQVKDPLENVAKFFTDNGPKIGMVISLFITQPLQFLLGVIKDIITFAGDAITKINELISKQGAWPGIQQNSNIIGQRLSSGQSSVGDVVTAFLNATAKQIFGHDYAGSYSANQPYLVGTGAQPELFMPKSAGFAIPNFSAGALATAMPVSSPSSYAYNNTYNNQSQMGDINFNGVNGTDDAMRRYALLRAMGRVK